MKWVSSQVLRAVMVLGILSIGAMPAAAHCDTMSGPVVASARQALASADVTPVLKWIKPEHEAEVRDAFTRTLKVRKQNPESGELADRYFFETVVRIHRNGEGESYTGLKTGEPEHAIAAADLALANGEPDTLIEEATRKIAGEIRERFGRVQQTQKHAGDSVSAGREYVEAYVAFMHYVEKLHGGVDEGHEQK